MPRTCAPPSAYPRPGVPSGGGPLSGAPWSGVQPACVSSAAAIPDPKHPVAPTVTSAVTDCEQSPHSHSRLLDYASGLNQTLLRPPCATSGTLIGRGPAMCPTRPPSPIAKRHDYDGAGAVEEPVSDVFSNAERHQTAGRATPARRCAPPAGLRRPTERIGPAGTARRRRRAESCRSSWWESTRAVPERDRRHSSRAHWISRR